MTDNMIYTLNTAEAVKEAERRRERLTAEQLRAYDSIDDLDIDFEAMGAALFCILDRVSKTDFCAYSKDAQRAIERAAYDAYMMGRLTAEK